MNFQRTWLVFRSKQQIFIFDISKREYFLLHSIQLDSHLLEIGQIQSMVVNWRSKKVVLLTQNGYVYAKWLFHQEKESKVLSINSSWEKLSQSVLKEEEEFRNLAISKCGRHFAVSSTRGEKKEGDGLVEKIYYFQGVTYLKEDKSEIPGFKLFDAVEVDKSLWGGRRSFFPRPSSCQEKGGSLPFVASEFPGVSSPELLGCLGATLGGFWRAGRSKSCRTFCCFFFFFFFLRSSPPPLPAFTLRVLGLISPYFFEGPWTRGGVW